MSNLFLITVLILTAYLATTAQPANLLEEVGDKSTCKKEGKEPVKVFNGQKLIKANKMAVLPKGRLGLSHFFYWVLSPTNINKRGRLKRQPLYFIQ